MGLISGTFLSTNIKVLKAIPIILLLLPALNSLIGDFSIILISRLTTHLYIGTIPPKIQKTERLKKDFYGLLLSVFISVLCLIVLGYGIAIISEIKIINPILIILTIIMTVIILFLLLFIFLFICSIYLFKKGKDPNNFLIPFCTSLIDFLSPLVLIMFIQIFI
ncbi:hypothetical protein LCGC14_1357330 [marine sediment metagenome]|uniref:SLC41A/MgtE integral membrane domain-containing protein n=1 Tax=marine sediment metagenome TaxID=412755 RepID=A0A0F9K9R4_9ZZZZ